MIKVTAMNRRRIGFEKIQNARDLGGLRTEDGHTIASGLLFRSANLAEATEADMRAFTVGKRCIQTLIYIVLYGWTHSYFCSLSCVIPSAEKVYFHYFH